MPLQTIDVAKHAVEIDHNGHLTIKDPNVVALFKNQNIANGQDLMNKQAISVGVTVGT